MIRYAFHRMAGIIFLIPCALSLFLLASCRFSESGLTWISPAAERDTAYGVFEYQNTFAIMDPPEKLLINVSADNRYKLFLNGEQLGQGPARGCLDHWFYESYEIGSLLKPGKNVLKAIVWNGGRERPMAQISDHTAFCLFTADGPGRLLNTGTGNWSVRPNRAYHPVNFGNSVAGGYYVCGPGDSLVMEDYPDEVTGLPEPGEGWTQAVSIPGKESRWKLEKRNIPLPETIPDPSPNIVRTSGTYSPGNDNHVMPLTIPAHQKVSILLDQGYLTLGYPALRFSRGKDSRVRITYAEALFDANHNKGNRDETEGKEIEGYYDVVIPDGKESRIFTPLWLRTYRYVQLDVETSAEELVLEDFSNTFSAYPLSRDARFESDDPRLVEIMETGWRTLRLCAGETYFDCPYYEQLQYAGDTRVQSLITLYLSSDDRLVRNAIAQFHQSLQPEGITLSRYPSRQDQKIPPFSLYWISMIYDYYMLRDDDEFLEPFLPGIESVISYFEQYLDAGGLSGPMPHGDTVGGLPEYWYFEDWSRGFSRGIPQGVYDNRSSVISLHFANTLLQAAAVMEGFENPSLAAEYRNLAGKVNRAVMEHCYDPQRGLIAQTPDKKLFSQHANILGVLSGAIPKTGQAELMEHVLHDPDLIQCSMYFQFYLFQAMVEAGLGDRYLESLGFWYRSLEMGLTTFPEKERSSRSDCHAWNASPCYDFLATVAGIRPASPGFWTVRISPHFGHLSRINASMPHPNGFVRVFLEKNADGKITGKILLPDNVKGNLEISNKSVKLVPGEQGVML